MRQQLDTTLTMKTPIDDHPDSENKKRVNPRYSHRGEFVAPRDKTVTHVTCLTVVVSPRDKLTKSTSPGAVQFQAQRVLGRDGDRRVEPTPPTFGGREMDIQGNSPRYRCGVLFLFR